MINLFLISLALVWMIFASVEDLRKREVEDWVSYSLIIFAVGIRFFYSLFYGDYSVFYSGLIGLGIFFLLGNLFYYSRIFAGADAKLMIALGVILPFSNSFLINFKLFFLFLFLFFIVGGVYGLAWSFVLSIKNFKKFKVDFHKRIFSSKKLILSTTFFGLVIFFFGFFMFPFFLLGILLIGYPYLLFYSKSVDSVAMVKNVLPKELTIGDWLVNDILVGKKLIKANWDGLTKEEIQVLKKRNKRVLVRYGIPFIPVFLISFILYLISYNLIFNIL